MSSDPVRKMESEMTLFGTRVNQVMMILQIQATTVSQKEGGRSILVKQKKKKMDEEACGKEICKFPVYFTYFLLHLISIK